MSENSTQLDYKSTNESVHVFASFLNISTTTTSVLLSYTNAPYILSIIFYTISTCGILFNLFTITIIRLHRPMHKQLINRFIANQSVIDTLASTLLIFSSKFQYDYSQVLEPGKHTDEVLCRLWYSQAPMWSLLLSSTYGIIALNFERYLAVVHPVWHKLYFSKEKVIILIVGTWSIGPCFYIPYAVMTSCITSFGMCSIYTCYTTRIQSYSAGICCFLVAYVIPLGLLIYFYITMILAMHRKKLPSSIIAQKDEGLHSEIETADNKGETNNLKGSKQRTANNKLPVIGIYTNACTSSQKATQPLESVEPLPSENQRDLNIMINVAIESSLIPQRDEKIIEKSSSSVTSQTTAKSTEIIHQQESAPVETRKNGRISTKKKTEQKESAFAIKARGNIIKTLVLVSIGFVLCWSGSEVLFLLTQTHLVQTNYTGEFYNFTVVMVFLSCCVNPVIYCIQYRQFQNGVKKVLSRAEACIFKFNENKIRPTVRI